jgi:TetR/AcrR family transcriptional repressor of nem operon
MTSPKSPVAQPTTIRILEVAERLVQTRGFNGFSYADIAAEVGITKASLHYHFATKADLGRTLIERYSSAFEGALQHIMQDLHEPQLQLRAYVQIYAKVLADERMCLCGMLAAEFGTLPEPMQHALRAFFALNERWLASLLERGEREGCFVLRVPASEAASMLVSALEGAMLVARASGETTKFESAARLLLWQLAPAHRPASLARAARPRAAGARPAAVRAARGRNGPRS